MYVYPFQFTQCSIQCKMYDSLKINVSFNIAYIYIDTYRLFCSEMAESHQRGREPTGVSSNKNIL